MKQSPGQTSQKKPCILTGVDFEILQFVHEYHFLTVEQIVMLRYSKNSLPTAQLRLKALAEAQYLDRRHLPHMGTGNTAFLYYLTTKGQHALEAVGCESDGFSRVRKSEIAEMQYPHLQHVLLLNDFLIAARLLPRFVPALSVVEMRHDLDLKKTPVFISGGRGKKDISVVPDAWIDVRMTVADRPKPRRRCIVVELDRGTVPVQPFKQKLRSLYEYAISESYQHLFNTNLCLIAFATTGGEARLKHMKEWCEQELTRLQLEEEANLYRFTALPKELDPKQLFCEAVWYKPFEDGLVSLLWKQ